jgi:chaperonin GroES
MTLKPLLDRVLVERVDSEKVTAGGIVIPDTATEKADQGVVISVGPGKYDEHGVLHSVPVQPGDRVLFGRLAGQTTKVDGKEFLILRADDIFAVVVK